jgi:alkanesulfonate monooxygenase SsuD/methylene tetrahydromethanopterin reductase-like flavin-dependent oxidoreductase (luciferase family)
MDAIIRAGRDGINLLLDQIAPVDLIIERVAAFRTAVADGGNAGTGLQIAAARALLLATTEEERKTAVGLRRKSFVGFGALARGRGAERYMNPDSMTDDEIAQDTGALLGSPQEIIARLKLLEAGGVDYVILVDPTASQRALRMFADEVMPEFAAPPAKRAAKG